MELMDKKDERRIMGALDKIAQDVRGGAHPNAAVLKVAHAEEFTAPMLQRMIEATNTALQLSHLKMASGRDRANVIPLADPKIIFNDLYPESIAAPSIKKASAFVPSEYKTASDRSFMQAPLKLDFPPLDVQAYPPDAHYEACKAYDVLRSLEKNAEANRTEYRIQAERVAIALRDATAYFDQLNTVKFAEIEKRVVSEYGPLGKACMDTIYERSRAAINGEKRAELDGGTYVFDRSKQPYGQITTFIESAQALVKRAADYWSAEDMRVRNERENSTKLYGQRKAASTKPLDSLIGSAGAVELNEGPASLRDTLGKSANFPKAAVDLADSLIDGGARALGFGESTGPNHAALSQVLNPEHDAEMRAAKARAMLHEFMTTDPIISSHDPKKVSDAFNSISTLAPNLVSQPAVMRGSLRKILQQEGVMEPFEADQLSKLDKSLVTTTKDTPVAASLGLGSR